MAPSPLSIAPELQKVRTCPAVIHELDNLRSLSLATRSHTAILLGMRLRTVFITVLGLIGLYLYFSKSIRGISTEAAIVPSLTSIEQQHTTKPTSAKTFSQKPAPTGPATVADIYKSIQEDHYCEENRSLVREVLFPRLDNAAINQMIYQALTQEAPDPNFDPCVLAQLTKDRSEAINLSRSSNAIACRFTLALILTNQTFRFEEPKSTDAEMAEGLEILRELKGSDPDNGIYPFLLMGALKTDADGESESNFFDFLRTSKFENPVTALQIRTRELGAKNATAYLLAVEVVSSISTPQYQRAYEVTKGYFLEASQLKTAWAKRFEARLREIDEAHISEPFVSLAELSGLKALAKAYLTTNPREGALPDIFADEKWVPLFRRISGSEDYMEMHSVADGCHSTHMFMRNKLDSELTRFWNMKGRAQGR